MSASLEQGSDEAIQVMRALQRTGIDVPQVTRRLLDDGIGKFVDSLNDILQTIGTRAMTGPHGEPASSADRTYPDAATRLGRLDVFPAVTWAQRAARGR